MNTIHKISIILSGTVALLFVAHKLYFKKLKKRTVSKSKMNLINSADSSLLCENSESSYLIDKIIRCFEQDKVYTNPRLKIADLAKSIGTNRNYLSRAVNGYFMLNFNQLCNYFRVREACRIYVEEGLLPREVWMRRSGFISSSSFSSSFSLFTGRSPARWQREVRLRLQKNEKVSIDEYVGKLKDMIKK